MRKVIYFQRQSKHPLNWVWQFGYEADHNVDSVSKKKISIKNFCAQLHKNKIGIKTLFFLEISISFLNEFE